MASVVFGKQLRQGCSSTVSISYHSDLLSKQVCKYIYIYIYMCIYIYVYSIYLSDSISSIAFF